jgi:hypothetical protein
MKRIQRETFSDVMKFKEKHDQIEHILSLYKTGKGFEFLDLPIQVKIALDAVGALFLVDDTEFEQAKATLDKVGRTTGLSSRFVFESKTRGKDTIAAELSTQLGAGDHLGRPVQLTRLQYSAQINKWLSMTLVPFGARCNSFLHSSSMIQVCPFCCKHWYSCCFPWTKLNHVVTDEIMKIVVRIYRVKPLLMVHLHFSNITTAALV